MLAEVVGDFVVTSTFSPLKGPSFPYHLPHNENRTFRCHHRRTKSNKSSAFCEHANTS